MRALVQRVSQAHVLSEGVEVGRIGPGLVALVGVTHDDDEATARRLADKVHTLRVFADHDGGMNRSVADLDLEVLVVSQFTLYADTRKGRRPSFVAAARPEHAEPLVDAVVARLRECGVTVATGRFRTMMQVHLVNDGPVTLLVEV
jgi:D-tyrosyl-tRNA(Tyr) deacylase